MFQAINSLRDLGQLSHSWLKSKAAVKESYKYLILVCLLNITIYQLTILIIFIKLALNIFKLVNFMRILIAFICFLYQAVCFASPPTNALEFAISNLTITQPSLVISGGTATFQGAETITVKVWVTVTGVLPQENRYVGVSALAGMVPPGVPAPLPPSFTAPSTQVLPVTTFVGGRWVYLTFQRNELELGRTIFGATVNPVKTVPESNMSNNYIYYNVPTQVHCNVRKKGRTITHLQQDAALWTGDQFGHGPSTLGKKGCATTSLAMLLKSYGLTQINNFELTPRTLNAAMTTFTNTLGNNVTMTAYNPNNNVIWANVAKLAHSQFKTQCEAAGGTSPTCTEAALNRIAFKLSADFFDQQLPEMGRQLCSGNPLILETPGISDTSKSHFVLATSTGVDAIGNLVFLADDPFMGDGRIVPMDEIEIKGIRVFMPTRDPAMLLLSASENVDYVITDPLGRRTGYNPLLNIHYNEIPDATYSRFDGIDDVSGSGNSTPAENEFNHLYDVLAGIYTIQIYSVGGGNFSLDATGYDDNGNPNNHLNITNSIAAGGSLAYYFTQVNTPVRALIPSKMKIQDFGVNKFPLKNDDQIRLRGKFDSRVEKFDSSISFKIGSEKTKISRHEFEAIGYGKDQMYIYASREDGIFVTLKSSGEFSIAMKKLPSSMQISDIEKVKIEVDDSGASTNLRLKCNETRCEGSPI